MKPGIIRTSDYVSVGIYTAIYFVLVAICVPICIFLIPGYSYIYISVIAALLTGSIFMLSAARIPRFGAISIMGSIMGIFFFASGRFPEGLLPAIIISMLADGIAYYFNYRSKPGLLLSFVVFAFSTIGPSVALFFTPDKFVQNLLNQGRDMDYINQVLTSITTGSKVALLVGIVVAALIGGLLGQRLMKRHFERAGMI